MKIAIIGHNLWGVGGTVRTIYNLAEGLEKRHEIELVSVYRRVNEAAFSLPTRTKLTSLVDGRLGSADRSNPEYYEPSIEVPPTEEMFSQYSRLTDARIIEYLSSSTADVVIGTRPSINFLVARFANRSQVLIGQEHSAHETIDEQTRDEMRKYYGALDAITTVTKANAAAIRDSLALPDTDILAIPNSVPAPRVSVSSLENPLIIGAGRIEPAKRFELLVHAFSELAADFPEWKVRLYGVGRSVGPLRTLIHEYGLADRVRLMGATDNMGDEWAKASIAVSTSDFESFGMTIVEAMRAGVPLISTDCPTGPREIITDQVDGILVPTGEVQPLKEALRSLMTSRTKREDLARAGLGRGRDFDVEHVANEHAKLFARLARRRHQSKFIQTLAHRTRTQLKASNTVETPTICVAGSPGGTVEFSILNPNRVNVDALHVVLTSSHKRDPSPLHEVLHPRTAFTAQFDSANFKNDALWDVTITAESGEALPAKFLVDNQRIVDRPINTGTTKHSVPFVDEGQLKIRTWKRSFHTEVAEIDVQQSGITVVGASSFQVSSDAVVTLSRRSDDLRLHAPISVRENTDGSVFSCTLPLEEMIMVRVGRHDDWDLTLTSGNRKSKLARILDDIPNHKYIDIYDAWSTVLSPLSDSSDAETVAIRPFYTPRQGLSLNVITR